MDDVLTAKDFEKVHSMGLNCIGCYFRSTDCANDELSKKVIEELGTCTLLPMQYNNNTNYIFKIKKTRRIIIYDANS